MDIQLREEYEKEAQAPFTDGLTGLFNHGFFQISLEREIQRSKRHGTSFTLALIDIDGFSIHNRSRGYLSGERILKETAEVIKESIRQVDLAARYSGDVIAVILENAETHEALGPAERIRQAVERNSGGAVTVSIGLASFPQNATDLERLIGRAEEALIQAKVKGKNKTHFLESDHSRMGGNKPRVLAVDDDPRNLKLLEAILLPLDYEVIKAVGGEEALSVVSKVDVDLVLLDIMMPGMDGYEVCRRLKGDSTTRLIPVVLITALDDLGAKIKGIEVGADDFITKPPNKLELVARTKSLIKLKKLNNNLTSIENALFSMANAVEAKDTYTQGHTLRVSNLAVTLGKLKGLTPPEIEALGFGGILHDIGKIGVPREILNKPGPLSREEWEIIKNHPDMGYKICVPLQKNLGPALEVIRHHHEKLDGSGYPSGLEGEEISTVARIMAVVDIYDALVTDRPYRKGVHREEAFGILRKEAAEGKVDGELVEYLVEVICGWAERREDTSMKFEEAAPSAPFLTRVH